MEYYSHSDNPIMIAHFPGKSRQESNDLMMKFKETKFVRPFGVQFISIINREYLKSGKAILDYQLKRNGIDYLNPAKNDIFKWSMPKKIKYILKALKQTKEPYSLILDGGDVAIVSDMGDIVRRFETYDVDILYNATIWPFPKQTIDDVGDRDQYGKYCHLNAGCCFGKTKALIKFYKECYEVAKADKFQSNSEQYYIRQVFDKHIDTVFFDYDCRIFQVWHKPCYEYYCKVT